MMTDDGECVHKKDLLFKIRISSSNIYMFYVLAFSQTILQKNIIFKNEVGICIVYNEFLDEKFFRLNNEMYKKWSKFFNKCDDEAMMMTINDRGWVG